tara:strand:- start:944 stop:1534 length:591 start_codon:yes stop_codon:yes gene_type:complete
MNIIKKVHPAVWLILGLIVVMLVRTRMEHSRVQGLVANTQDPKTKGILIAESARWAWPLGPEQARLLNKSLSIADTIQTKDPQAAGAIAEEVRATLYATRVNRPIHPDILQRANTLIVQSLKARDQLQEPATKQLENIYAKPIGPKPWAFNLSSLGFLAWLFGLFITIWGKTNHRIAGILCSTLGLIAYLGFLAVA